MPTLGLAITADRQHPHDHAVGLECLAAVDGGKFADILTNAGKFDVTEDRRGSAQLVPQSAVGRGPNDVKPLAGPSGGDRAESADVKGGGERPGPPTPGECGGKGLQVHPYAQTPGGKGLC